MAIPFRRGLITVDDFQRMAETGVFARDARLELIRGEIVEMAPIGKRHFGCVRRLNYRLNRRLGDRAVVDIQNPLWLGDHQSNVYPDVILLSQGFLSDEMPKPKDVVLVIEVADSSLAYDRDVKIPLYAESGIPEAWLVDLNSKAVFVYRRPSAEGYREVRQYRRGDAISSQAFPNIQFAVDEILG
jgi:Uma2 family endonuclease